MSKFEEDLLKRAEVSRWLMYLSPDERTYAFEACLARLMELGEIRFRQDDVDIEEGSWGFYWTGNGRLITATCDKNGPAIAYGFEILSSHCEDVADGVPAPFGWLVFWDTVRDLMLAGY